jgi:catechol 2,3-dioxygenase-like lactoylglutathione lyase family enzyme
MIFLHEIAMKGQVIEIQMPVPPDYWNPLVPELDVSDLEVSLRFYVNLLGFRVRFCRAEPAFAYLELGQAQMMLEQQHSGAWLTAELVRPFGRGINFQIEVEDAAALAQRLEQAGAGLFRPLEEKWYAVGGGCQEGQLQFLVQDPDGYLLRFVQSLGSRVEQRSSL